MGNKLKRINLLVSALFSVVFVLFTSVACAESVTWDVELAVTSNPEFVQSSQSDFLFSKADYIDSGQISAATTIKMFFDVLDKQNKAVLPEPLLVPVGVGDILIFVPYQGIEKRIGDLFVQLRYIRNQIHSILGRHIIDSTSVSDEVVQVNNLYGSALSYSLVTDVEFGQPLTEDQKNSIDVDIIWPEYRQILGQQVIVPVVYLSSVTVEDRAVNGHLVEFEGDASFEKIEIISGQISVKRDAFLVVREDLRIGEGSSIEGDGDLNLVVGGTLRNYSGEITAVENVLIIADTLYHSTVIHRFEDYFGWGGRAGEIADINSQNGDITINTFSDIVVSGGEINSSGSITLSAGGVIRLESRSLNTSTRFGEEDRWTTHSESSINLLQSRLTAEENISLLAQFITIDAAEIISSQGHIELLADYGIYITNDYSEYSQERSDATGDNQKHINQYRTSAVRAFLDAGIGVTLTTRYGDVVLRAVDFNAETAVDISASNGAVKFLLAREQDHYFKNSVEENSVRIKVTESGHQIERPVYTTIVGGLSVNALYGVEVEYASNAHLSHISGGLAGTLEFSDLTQDLSTLDGLQWLNEIPQDSITWTEAELLYRRWHDSDRSLTPEATTVLAIIVSIATNGAGAGLVGAAEGSAYAYMANAAFTTLVTQAATVQTNALLDGEVLSASELYDEMARSDYSNQLIVSIITQGVLANFPQGNAHFFSVGSDGEISLIDQAYQNVVKATLRQGISIVVNDGDLGDIDGEFLRNTIQEHAVFMLGRYMAETIGNAFDPSDPTAMDTALKYIAHAGSGCIYGALSAELNDSDDIEEACGTGAGGAVIGEFVSEQNRRDLDRDIVAWVGERLGSPGDYSYGEFDREIRAFLNRGIDLGRFTAALAAFAAGANVDLAASAADIAARYNSTLDMREITSRSSFNFVVRQQQIGANPAVILFSDSLFSSFNKIFRILGGETLDVVSDDFFRSELEKYPSLSNAISAAIEAGMQDVDANVEAYFSIVLLNLSSTYAGWIDGADNVSDGGTVEELTVLEAGSIAYDLRNAIVELRDLENVRLYYAGEGNESSESYFQGEINDKLTSIANILARYPSLRGMVEHVDSSPPGFPINENQTPITLINPIPDLNQVSTLIRAMLDEPIDSTLPGSPIPEESVPWREEILIPEQNPLDSILFNDSGEPEPFPNRRPERLEEELQNAIDRGVAPIRVDSEEFEQVVNTGYIKWAVTTEGELLVVEKYDGNDDASNEIDHTVISGGADVIAAGEAHVVVINGVRMGLRIDRHSGHFRPSAESLDIGLAKFAEYGITFNDVDYTEPQ